MFSLCKVFKLLQFFIFLKIQVDLLYIGVPIQLRQDFIQELLNQIRLQTQIFIVRTFKHQLNLLALLSLFFLIFPVDIPNQIENIATFTVSFLITSISKSMSLMTETFSLSYCRTY